MSATVKTSKEVYKITKTKQLIDLNNDFVNFNLTFNVKSTNKEPFYALVVHQKNLDNGDELDYKHVNSGNISGEFSSDTNVLYNYFLIIKADEPCECEVTINLQEIPPDTEKIKQQQAQQQQYEQQQAQQQQAQQQAQVQQQLQYEQQQAQARLVHQQLQAQQHALSQTPPPPPPPPQPQPQPTPQPSKEPFQASKGRSKKSNKDNKDKKDKDDKEEFTGKNKSKDKDGEEIELSPLNPLESVGIVINWKYVFFGVGFLIFCYLAYKYLNNFKIDKEDKEVKVEKEVAPQVKEIKEIKDIIVPVASVNIDNYQSGINKIKIRERNFTAPKSSNTSSTTSSRDSKRRGRSYDNSEYSSEHSRSYKYPSEQSSKSSKSDKSITDNIPIFAPNKITTTPAIIPPTPVLCIEQTLPKFNPDLISRLASLKPKSHQSLV